MERTPDFHVVPIDDVIAHEEVRQCWCRPVVEEGFDGAVVTHFAADGREYFEEPDDVDHEQLIAHDQRH